MSPKCSPMSFNVHQMSPYVPQKSPYVPKRPHLSPKCPPMSHNDPQCPQMSQYVSFSISSTTSIRATLSSYKNFTSYHQILLCSPFSEARARTSVELVVGSREGRPKGTLRDVGDIWGIYGDIWGTYGDIWWTLKDIGEHLGDIWGHLGALRVIV